MYKEWKNLIWEVYKKVFDIEKIIEKFCSRIWGYIMQIKQRRQMSIGVLLSYVSIAVKLVTGILYAPIVNDRLS